MKESKREEMIHGRIRREEERNDVIILITSKTYLKRFNMGFPLDQDSER